MSYIMGRFTLLVLFLSFHVHRAVAHGPPAVARNEVQFVCAVETTEKEVHVDLLSSMENLPLPFAADDTAGAGALTFAVAYLRARVARSARRLNPYFLPSEDVEEGAARGSGLLPSSSYCMV